jgi:hypothetical protein
MIPPKTAGANLAAACLLGALCGLIYGFLRPLRRRSAGLADSIFILFAIFVWLHLSFGICGGDLRLGYWIGLLTGGFLWELTAGRLLRPVFRGFWKCIFLLADIPIGFFKKILKKIQLFFKKLFAYKKKSGTIEWNMYPHSGKRKGGRHHGRQQSLQQDPFCVQAQQASDQGCSAVRYCIVYGDTSRAPAAAAGRSDSERYTQGSGISAGAGKRSTER